MRKIPKFVAGIALSTALTACATISSNDSSSVEAVETNTNVVANYTPTGVITPATNDTITLEQIMADPKWMGRSPEKPGWSLDSQYLVYEQVQKETQINDVFVAPVSNPENAKKVSMSQRYEYRFDEKTVNPDNTVTAFRVNNSLFVKESGQPVRQLIRGGEAFSGLRFMTDGRLMMQQGNKIIAMNIHTGQREELMSWRFADKPVAVEPAKDYLAKEQIGLIDYVKVQRKNRQDAAQFEEDLSRASVAYAPKPLFFDKQDKLVSASVSPNGKYAIVVTTENTSSRDESDIMPHYVQESGRIASIGVRSRVADAKPVNHDIWLVNLHSRKKTPLSLVNLPGYNEDVLADVKAENAAARGETYQVNRLPRDITLLGGSQAVRWHDSGDDVALMLEAWDNKDRWIVTVDFDNAKLLTQERLHDDAWINYSHNHFGWLHQSHTLFYQSEKDGYSHLYLQKPGEQAIALTQGQYVVENPTLSADDQYLYYQANKTHPGIVEVYRVDTQSGATEQLTALNGMTEYVLSPDGQQLLLTHSKVNRPPELYIKSVSSKQLARQITHTVSDTFLNLPWAVPTVVAVPSSHTEQPIYARVYLPKGDNNGEKRRAVVFTHGAGYLQNAHLGWSGYFREYMFHSMLVQQGYVVLDMDYRASKGYGRDWRTAIYRHMGKPEVEDLRDGVQWLVDNAQVDPDRIGTYGGSYGGFLTFMSMFTEPDLFAAGAALRPVTDWAHYNTGYTSNILNTPDIDPIAYKRSSPIYFAQGLEKPLLIVSPMVDNNVFFEDSVRLVQRLIELEKTDFETAIYPVESHGFIQPSSWLNEYRRIYKLFETNL
ncbi:prolyl oligopeptidase family serine peptidase [Alteromonas sp. C1M14]|uniref:S9 family peptidase n=1 Tax=Alteromonas sp. C1M14 TaxID=2841567 RepID=UPI001C083DF7|nr:prolyl oligopeptidase family serine peptidase [Alteromonas sp. C1M14]MBU2976763.1 prolyl oligopeptidase family serine peptidase [Alteromonas sp. C1M14]